MVHPRPELALPGESMSRPEHPVEHILHHILAYLALLRHMKEESIQRPVVSLEQQAHLIQIAGSYL